MSPRADDDRTCHRRADLLLADPREGELRATADAGRLVCWPRWTPTASTVTPPETMALVRLRRRPEGDRGSPSQA
jgi:hypothetical protein